MEVKQTPQSSVGTFYEVEAGSKICLCVALSEVNRLLATKVNGSKKHLHRTRHVKVQRSLLKEFKIEMRLH